MKTLSIELPWPPSVNRYYRNVRGRTLISREGRNYREEVIAILRNLHIQPLENNLEMYIEAFPPDRRRRDADNIMKAIFDSLQHGGAYADDSQIKKFTCEMMQPYRPEGKVAVRLSQRE